tara:strand:+ start:3134 stop:3265 length:132 start_codon:yes stop_codon:yes gene_type:complete
VTFNGNQVAPAGSDVHDYYRINTTGEKLNLEWDQDEYFSIFKS